MNIADSQGAPPSIPTEIVGGAEVAALTRKETARLFVEAALASRGRSIPALVCTSVNGQVLADMNIGSKAAGVSGELAKAWIVSADGQPLIFASRMLGKGGLTERVATTDLFHDVAELAPANNLTFYMLGASPEENRAAVENVRRMYPSLKIVGARDGYFKTEAEEQAVVDELNALKPDVVWVAMGFPRELEFCNRLRHKLTNVGVMKTSGGLFNFLSGTRSRAPAWMQDTGLEWAYRLYLEPRRLFMRYATSNFIATWLLITQTRRHTS